MRKKQFVRVLTTVVSLLALNLYFGIHVQEFLFNVTTTKWVALFWIVFELISIPLLISVMPMPSITIAARRFLKVTAHSILGFSILLLYWFIAYDLIYIVTGILGYELRNEFAIAYGITALVGSMVIFVIGLRNAFVPKISKYTVEIEKETDCKNNLKVIMVSDIHLGNIVGNRHLARLVKIVNGMDADLILFIGDTIDDTIEPFVRNNMREPLQELKSKYGKYAVLGNHDYYGGDVNVFCSEMSKSGVQVLQDEVLKVCEGVVLVGRKDKVVEEITTEGRLAMDALMLDVNSKDVTILMDHQPYGFDVAQELGVDLALYGHTHRGQMAPYHLLTGRKFELDWGYVRKGKCDIIVSCGFGIWGPPLRLRSRAEIVEIDLILTR